MLSIEIRPVELPELDDVIRLNRVTLPENYPPQFFQEIMSQYPKAFLVAKSGSFTVGYVMMRIEKSLSLLRWVNRAHVISVAVHKSFRRQGIGRRLLATAAERCNEEYGAVEVYLEVRVSNNEAVGLYRSMGFVIKDVNQGYYSDGEDAYVMQAPLPLPMVRR